MATQSEINAMCSIAERISNQVANGRIYIPDIQLLLNKVIQLKNPKQPISKKKKSDPIIEHVLEIARLHRTTRVEAKALQKKFNLATAPHSSRVLQYQQTKDPAVFAGLKRLNR